MGLLSKLQEEFKKPKYYTETELEGPVGTISLNRLDLGPDDVWRYRKMRGVNLGTSGASFRPLLSA